MSLFRTLILLLLAPIAYAAQPGQTLLLRQPTVAADKIAFVYAGDIWVANRDGSSPYRLTSSAADEGNPIFSPDGSQIAFAADYEDNTDVYVIATTGGQPKRLTWYPGRDVPTGWTADGRSIALMSERETDHGRSGQLYHVSLDGGLPGKQMEARFYRGSYDSANKRLAYIAFGSGYGGLFGGAAGWKGYRGGTTPAIQIMNLAEQTVVTVDGAGVTNFNPFWLDGNVYFLSDRDKEIYNLYRYTPGTGVIDKVSNETVWDIRSAAGYGSIIVYESGGHLKELNLASGTTKEIAISVSPDLPQLRPQWKDASDAIQGAEISSTGKRAVVVARGEVFTVPTKDGSTRNISGTGGAREYSPLWSPDGGKVAYVTESKGGQSLVVSDQTGQGDKKAFVLGSHFYDLLQWSNGDNPRIVFEDNHLNLSVISLETGKIKKIATGTRRESVETALSTDGRWLAYTQEQPNYQRDLVLYNFNSAKSTVVTDRLADIASPAFSRDGKYLYFAASTNSGPIQVGLNMTSQERPYRAGLYAMVLADDGESPLLPKAGDEEDNGSADKDDEKGGKQDKKGEKNEKDEKDAVPETRIDLAALSDRIVALPVAERSYDNLAVGQDGSLFYVQNVQPGISNEPPGENAASNNELLRFNFEKKEATTLLKGVNSFSMSHDGEHMIIGMADGSIKVSDVADEMSPEPLDLSGLRIRVEPRQEWAQIFNEAWRMEKEYFYAPTMHGLDWQAVYDRYRPLVEHVGRREDLNELMREMIGEMQVGHNNVGGGDTHAEQRVSVGLLGANFMIVNGAYQFAKVYNGESWNPFFKAPLATPGNSVKAGEYLLAVNGKKLSAADNVFQELQGTTGQQVTLRVGPNANGKDAREVTVEPIASERALRLWSWIDDNRRQVDEATNGQVAYVYLPDTADDGYTFFNRMFYAQIDKRAVIIDERSNSGGQAANYITEVLSRKHLSGWKDRDGKEYDTPAGAIHGPKVMLIDQDAGSGGDYLPYAFRQLGIGKLIGTRTWGGLIGIYNNPELMDGGFLTVPFFRFYDASGHWSVENQGVAPDINVALDPIATNRGHDTQLDAAIAEVLKELDGYESGIPDRAPPFPTELGE